jgi:hypothetical protein
MVMMPVGMPFLAYSFLVDVLGPNNRRIELVVLASLSL